MTNKAIDAIKTLTSTDKVSKIDELSQDKNMFYNIFKNCTDIETSFQNKMAYHLKKIAELESNLASVTQQKESDLLTTADLIKKNEDLIAENLLFTKQVSSATEIDKLQDLIINQSAQIRTLKTELTNYILSDTVKS